MVAPDPNDPVEREAHIRKVLDSMPDYYCGSLKPPPLRFHRPMFPPTLPPASAMTDDEINHLQLADCFNEVDYIKTPDYVKECLKSTRIKHHIYREVVRYAWERLICQQNDIADAEALLDKLQLVGSDRGYGRKGEAYLERAERVGDEEWLTFATIMEMKRETELAGNERAEMEGSEKNLLQIAELEMEANSHWGTGPFDVNAPRPNIWIKYCPIREAAREAEIARRAALGRRGRRGGAHHSNSNRRNNGNNNNHHNGSANGENSGSRNTTDHPHGTFTIAKPGEDPFTDTPIKLKSLALEDPFVDNYHDQNTPKADVPTTPTPTNYRNGGRRRILR